MAHRAKNPSENSPKKRDSFFIDLSSDDEVTADGSPQDNRVSSTSHHHLKSTSSHKKSPLDHPEQEYVVKDVLDHEENKEGVRYKVLWKKLPGEITESITWEPEPFLKNCQELLRKYWQKCGEARTKKKKERTPRSSRKSSSKSPKKREMKRNVSSDEDLNFRIVSDKSSVDHFKKEKGIGERSHSTKDQFQSKLEKYQRYKKEKERKKNRRVRAVSESSESVVDVSKSCHKDDDSGFDVVMLEDDASDQLTNVRSKSHGSSNSDSGFDTSSRINFNVSASFHGVDGRPEREGSPEINPVPAAPRVTRVTPSASFTTVARKSTVRLDEADCTIEPPGYPLPSDPPELLYVFELVTIEGLIPSVETWVVLFHGESGVRILTKEEAVTKYPDSVTRFFEAKVISVV